MLASHVTAEEETPITLDAPLLKLETVPSLFINKVDINFTQDIKDSNEKILNQMNKNPYEQHSKTYTKEKKYGNFALGTKTDSMFAPDSYSQTNTTYIKYNKKRFTLNTSYKNDAFTSLEKTGKGTFAFTPEYKLNNHVTLQNVYSTNFMDRNRKNELIFSLKPFKDDRMNFDLGAGQSYSDNTTPIRSQINFSTKFKF